MESKDTPSSSEKNSSKDSLYKTLPVFFSVIAKSVEVLASKANESATEKAWDKAERERKKIHDDRTYRRQGRTITIATIALAFNFVALWIAINQGSNAKHSAESAAKSAATAKQALYLSQKGRLAISSMPEIPINSDKFTYAVVKNMGSSTINIISSRTQFLDEQTYNDLQRSSFENENQKKVPLEIDPGQTQQLNSEKIVDENLEKFGVKSEVTPLIYLLISVKYSDEFGDKYLRRECMKYKFDGTSYKSYEFCDRWNETTPIEDKSR